MLSELQRLQDWYLSQCDEDWEHSYGVKIETLDNPGWWIEVDLQDTELEDREFPTLTRGDSEDDADWILCKVASGKFVGTGGARNLAELLQIFLTWAER